MRRFVCLALAVVLGGVACGGAKKSTESGSAAPTTAAAAAGTGAGAGEYRIDLEGRTDAFNGEFGAFFPKAWSARPGDTVTFNLAFASGVPHTVTLGTLVDKAVTKLDQQGPQASIYAQENSPEMLNLPDVFPHKIGAGLPDANQSSGQPCYLATGVPPLSLTGSAAACPKVAQPAFDGTQAFYNSGLLSKEGDKFTVKLADSIKPGTYGVICLIHRGTMTAKLTVADKTATVPPPAEVAAAGKKEFDTVVSTLTPVSQAAQKLTADKAALGSGDPSKYPDLVVAEFGPKSLSIPVGGTVTWHQFSFHTLAFGAADSDVGVLATAPDGSVHLQKSLFPAGFPTPLSLLEFPQPENGKPVTVKYTYPGTGFANTGILGSLPPVFITIQVTFPTAGTYAYRCLIHPDMKGEVKVG
jgi:plastocyanin